MATWDGKMPVWVLWYPGGDRDWHELTLDALEDKLVEDCKELVDECEQEILGGAHWDDTESGDDKRKEAWSELWEQDVLPQLENAIHDDGGVINFNPSYAIAQRCTYRVSVQLKPPYSKANYEQDKAARQRKQRKGGTGYMGGHYAQ